MMQIIPAVDLIDGRCVRLSKGDYGCMKQYDADPVDMVRQFADCGMTRVHMVDLDGAKQSAPCNLRILEKAASLGVASIEWGGGIKSDAALRSVFDAGAAYAVVGSVAALHPEIFLEWLRKFGGEKLVLGADVKNGQVAVNGWLESVPLDIDALVRLFLGDGLTQVICTEISRDGMLQGPDFDLYTRLQKDFPKVDFTVSGGVSSMADLEKLASEGLRRAIVGKAIYEGRITLKDLTLWSQRG